MKRRYWSVTIEATVEAHPDADGDAITAALVAEGFRVTMASASETPLDDVALEVVDGRLGFCDAKRMPEKAEWIEWRGGRWATTGWGLWLWGYEIPRPRQKWRSDLDGDALDSAARPPERPLTMHDVPMQVNERECRVFAEMVDNRGKAPVVMDASLMPEGVDEWQGSGKHDPVWGFVNGEAVCVVMPLRIEDSEWARWRAELEG